MINRPLLKVLLLWTALDVMFLILGVWKSSLFSAGVHGLIPDLLLGVLILGQYLRDTNRL